MGSNFRLGVDGFELGALVQVMLDLSRGLSP